MHPVECIQHIKLFRYNLKRKCYQGVASDELKATPTVQHREHPRSARGYLKERRTRDMNQIWWRVYSLSGRRGQWQIWCAFRNSSAILPRKHYSSPFPTSKMLFPPGMHSKEVLRLIRRPLSDQSLLELLCTTYSLVCSFPEFPQHL